MKRFAISDIHGCAKTFQSLLAQIQFTQEDVLYILGDYVDRGPDSKAVMDHIFALQADAYTVLCTKGNHEQIMEEALTDESKERSWLTYGGLETLQSFGVPALKAIPEKYMSWIHSLPDYLETDGYFLVHAGLNFQMENPLDDENAMLWIRDWHQTVDHSWLDDRLIVHGHTPTEKEIIKKSLRSLEEKAVLPIDAGCVFKKPGLGHLCAFDLDSKELYFEPNIDR